MTAVVEIRRLRADDGPFVAEMTAEAVGWDRAAGSAPPAVEDIRTVSRVADYFKGWPRDGDEGFVAEAVGLPIGACWFRRFTVARPGYGFLGEDVPGLGLAMRERYRSQGVGTKLLAATIDLAREQGVATLSLSVADGNRARRLYERAGFELVELDDGGSWTMRLALAGAGGTRQAEP